MLQHGIPIGTQEYLVQTKNKQLLHCSVAFYASSVGFLMPSDYLGPTPGSTRYQGVVSEIVATTPLDQYEARIAKRAAWELWASTPGGRLDESSVIFDAILFVETWGGSCLIGKVLSSLSLVGNVISADATSDSVRSEVQAQVIRMLWKTLVRRFAPLDKEWVVDLVTEATGKVIGRLGSDTTLRLTPSNALLQKIQSFRYIVDRPNFTLKSNQLRELNKH